MTTFAVSDVRRGALKPALDREPAIRSLLGARVEATSTSTRRLVACSDRNPLAQAAHDAFYEHLPLVLSPDAVWLCLAQGFARHVNLHVDSLRERFVAHAGRRKFTVEHLGIELGRPSPWPEAFTLFSDQLAAHLGKLRDLVVADFSTTGPVERAASEIVLMDAFQGYFEYQLSAGCGIPEITLLGMPDDWRSIRRRAQTFSEYGLAAWTDVLLPVLDQLVATASGEVDLDFWRSFFRHDSGSGGSELTGWILTLFPYLDELSYPSRSHVVGVLARPTRTPVWNPHLASWHQSYRTAVARGPGFHRLHGPDLPQIPAALSRAPVEYTDVRTRTSTSLHFVAGLVGVTQDESTLAVTPEFGWAVTYA